jgi:hypothetical protein
METKITDWAQVVSDRIVESVLCYMKVEAANGTVRTVEDALECVLSNSCAGPKAIERAQVALGLLRDK